MLHLLGQQALHLLRLPLGALYDQLVVDLEHQPGLQPLPAQAAVHVEHGLFNEIGGGALDGHVQRHPLAEGAQVEVGGLELRQPPAAAHEGGHIAVGLGPLHHLGHIGVDAGIFLKVLLHIRLGLRPGHPDVLGQGEVGDAVDDAEVHRLGPAAHLVGHLLRGHAEHLGGGDGVDILPSAEGGNHVLVPRNVGQQAQFNLGVVRIHQHPPRGGHKHLAQLRPQLGADGDVLEVGLGGAQPPGGGDGVLEGGVDASVGGDDLGQPVHIGGFQLGQLPVVQHCLHNGVLVPQLLQHVGVGGVARLGLFHWGQAQLVKQDAAELLGGVDVELLPRQLVDEGLVGLNTPVQQDTEVGQRPPVHQHARPFHFRQHGTEGQLQPVIELVHVQLLQLGGEGTIQRGRQGGVGAHGLRRSRRVGQGAESVGGQVLLCLGELLVKIGDTQLLQLVAAVGGREQIGGQGGVKAEPVGAQSLVQQQVHQILDIVGHLLDLPGEQGPQQLIVPLQPVRRAQGSPGSAVPSHRHHIQRGQGQHRDPRLPPPLLHQLRHANPVGDALLPDGPGGGLVRPSGRRAAAQPHLVDELVELQRQKQLVQGGAVRLPPPGVLGGKVDGRVAADGGQIIGHSGLFFPLGQLFLDRGLGLHALHVGVDGLHALVALDQIHRGLLPNALDAWNVVAGVPHQRLQVHDVDGRKAVGLLEGLRGHLLRGGLPHSGGHQLDPGAVRDQLE